MKKLVSLSLFIIMLFTSNAFAMTFNQPQKIGSYRCTHAGGPSKATASGYTRATKDSFIFGTGDDALIIKYRNTSRIGRGASETRGVYVGKNLVLNSTIGFPYIYKITSLEGDLFYLGIGNPTIEQEFCLIGKCAGSYWHAIKMSDLVKYVSNIEYLDSDVAKRFGEPYTQGNKIIVPYTVSGINGKIIFTWDANVQWFGIEEA